MAAHATASAASAASGAAPPSLGLVGGAREIMRQHPFESVLSVWGGVLVAVGINLWRRQIPFQLKVITARILAQAVLVGGAGTFAVAALTANEKHHAGPATSSWVIRNFDDRSEEDRNLPAMGRKSLIVRKEREAKEKLAAEAAAEAALHAEAPAVAAQKLQ